MPELPEVEWVRRDLQRAKLTGHIDSLYRSRLPLRIGTAWREERIRTIHRAQSVRFSRRGKHLIWELLRGVEPWGLVIHLGMSGRLELCERGSARPVHTHFEAAFADGRALRFIDPRRFGGLRAGPLDELQNQPPLSRLGIEPLDPGFCGESLRQGARGSTRAIWEVLLDQRVVAGVGNIYALEALYRGRVHPLARANKIPRARWDLLAQAVVEALREGLRRGGTTLKDYRRPGGERGRNKSALWVYGRAGEACRGCGDELAPVSRGGRSGVFCPREQSRRTPK